MKHGIDVSHWQGAIDWEQVKSSGIDFVIVKAGGSDAGFYTDSKFEENYNGAKAAGLMVGAYYFVGKYCTTGNDGYCDAVRFLKIVEGKSFDLPLFIDIELTSSTKRTGATDAIIEFCNEIEKAGYQSGVYASKSFFTDRFEDCRLSNINHWIAQYNTECTYNGNYMMWQKSSTGSVPGVHGNVDLDELYDNSLTNNDDSCIVKYKRVTKAIVNAVIRGDYGNGEERKQRLAEAGYDYAAVQKAVNKALS